MNATQELIVGRKKSPEGKPKRYGTQVRTSDAFADLVVKAAALEGVSVAAFIDQHLAPIAERRYRAVLAGETKRLGGEK